MTNHPETPEMKAALPAQSSLGQVVDLDMKTGAFPPSGADLTFTLNDPVPADKVALIVNWDAGSQTWIPLASETSSDGKSVSAKLAHFSTYGLAFWSNLTGKLLGVRTNPPDCPAPPAPPSWDDNSAPQYFDDINGPVLWCAGADPANPDDLEIKLKLNRGAAAAITTAIKPVWTHSDLWQDDTPETWTQMVLAVGLQTGGPNPLVDTADSYFIQPTGEYTFRFAKADVLNFWHSNRTKPLIQVDATIPYVVAGLLYAQASDLSAIPALPLVTTLMALNQCSSEILSTGVDLHLSPSSQKALASELPGLMATLATCMASQMDPIAESVAKYWAQKKPASSLPLLEKSARFAGKGLMAAARLYALLQALAPVADALTDLLLDPIARQFIFEPSDQALKAYVQEHKPVLTKYVNLDPWHDKSGIDVSRIVPEPRLPRCTAEFRTAAGDGFYCGKVGACYPKPEEVTTLACLLEADGPLWKVYSNVQVDMSYAVLPDRENGGDAVGVELADGAYCHQQTGAGPQGVPGYPTWVGTCSRKVDWVWRGRADGKAIFGPSAEGYMQVGVSTETGPAHVENVTTIYR